MTVAVPEELAARIDGSLLREGDPGWEDALVLWNGMAAAVPALVVRPASAEDVATTIAFARAHAMPLGVKGGGHNIAGTAVADQGVVLDMSALSQVTVDPDARLAHVGAGCRLQDVDRATQEHGLATPLGFVSEVGVAGLTLGGGLGYLTRHFGWTVDNLEKVEIVTADGAIRTASRTDNSDLFWALRGGGGNFGVVTRFTFRLHEVGPTVYGGLIAWPFARADEILPAYRAITTEAPRELAVWLVLLRAPPAPFVPEDWHGSPLCAMAVCYSGDLDRADAALAPIRALGPPVVDLLQGQPYTDVQSYLDATEPKGLHYYWKTEYLAELSDGFLSELARLFADCPMAEADLGVLHLGGALNERGEDDGAVGNRDARWVFGVKGTWRPGEPDAEAFQRWTQHAWTQLRPSPPAERTSTSRRPMKARTGCETHTVRTTRGWSMSRRRTTPTTYSARTATCHPGLGRKASPAREASRAHSSVRRRDRPRFPVHHRSGKLVEVLAGLREPRGAPHWGAPGDTARVPTHLARRERTLTMTLTAFEPNRLVTYTSTQPRLPDARHERWFEPDERGFAYRLVVEYEPRAGIAGVFDRVVLAGTIRRTLERTLQALARELAPLRPPMDAPRSRS